MGTVGRKTEGLGEVDCHRQYTMIRTGRMGQKTPRIYRTGLNC